MSWLRKLSRGITKAVRNPIVKSVVGSVPMLGTAMAAIEGVSALNDLTGGAMGNALVGSSSSGGGAVTRYNAPATASMLPTLAAGTLGTALSVPMGSTSGPGILPRGVGGSLQMPWSDPNIPEYLKQFAIDDAYLKSVPRAPRGYVVLRDAKGRAFGVNKKIAQSLKLWRPKKKPPISVRDWESLKRANRTVNKLKRVVKMSKVVSMPTRRAPARKTA